MTISAHDQQQAHDLISRLRVAGEQAFICSAPVVIRRAAVHAFNIGAERLKISLAEDSAWDINSEMLTARMLLGDINDLEYAEGLGAL